MMKDYHYYKNKTRKGRQFYDIHTVDKVIKNILEVTNSDVTPDDIKGPNRARKLTELRLTAYWICFNVYDMPTVFIGKYLNKDHSTVIHGRQRMEGWYETDRTFKTKFDSILKKFEDFKNR